MRFHGSERDSPMSKNSRTIRPPAGSISVRARDSCQAREASDRTGLPLYFHTGELFEVDEGHRPEPFQFPRRFLFL